jgi:hypothetical protein
MRAIAVLTVALGGMCNAHAQTAEQVVRAGQLEYSFHAVEVKPPSPRSYGRQVNALAGFEIKNLGSVPLRLAVTHPKPTLHVDGGLAFRNGEVTGVEWTTTNIERCNRAAQDFTLLRPGQSLTASLEFQTALDNHDLSSTRWGRLGGQLMVQSADNQRCWKEAFTIGKVRVVVLP